LLELTPSHTRALTEATTPDADRRENAGTSDDGSGVSSTDSTSGNEPGATTEHMNRNKSVEVERLKYFKRPAVSAQCTRLAHPSF